MSSDSTKIFISSYTSFLLYIWVFTYCSSSCDIHRARNGSLHYLIIGDNLSTNLTVVFTYLGILCGSLGGSLFMIIVFYVITIESLIASQSSNLLYISINVSFPSFVSDNGVLFIIEVASFNYIWSDYYFYLVIFILEI